MIIAIDFDGTCVSHEYPKVGNDVPNCVNVLKKLIECNHKLMLWTMRGDKPHEGVNTLKDAVNWFKNRDIELWGINENPEQKEKKWSNSNKQYAQLYIDDAALGCPLSYPGENPRPYVDWYKVETILKAKNIIL